MCILVHKVRGSLWNLYYFTVVPYLIIAYEKTVSENINL